VEATVKAIPGARKNTMNGNTLPVYVLGIVREKGHPIQLVNAFETPVRSSQGYVAKSVELLKAENGKLAETWGMKAVFERAIPDVGMKPFLDGVVEHVI
jgi:CRISPR system Cascade subunit CasC